MMQTAVQHTSSDLASNVSASLSPVHAQVAAILAQGHSITAAARQAGIHRSTIYQWLQHSPDFKTTVEDAQQEYLATLTDEMRDLSASALRTLRGVLDNPETHDGIRLKAAFAVLQRPHYPSQGWNLPERIESPRQQQVVDTLDRRLSHGFALKVNYTLQKSLDDAPQTASAQHQNVVQNPLGIPDMYGTSDFDRTHRLVSNFIWQMPAPNQRLAGAVPGGWELTGIECRFEVAAPSEV